MGQIMEFSRASDDRQLKNRDVFVIVENERGEILLQKRSGSDVWELPGSVQESGKTNEEVTIKELIEEPGLHLAQLTLYRMFSRIDFSSYYAEGDEVFNDMAIYMAKSYFGYLRNNNMRSTKLRFFSLYDLPADFHETSKLIVDAYAADHFWIGG
jgi:ADP-ribose pyrophosphatase YjhB (NUDIX family)